MYHVYKDGGVTFVPPTGEVEHFKVDEYALMTVRLAADLEALPVIEKALDLQACFLSRSLSDEELNCWLYGRGVDLLASLPACADVRAHVLPGGGICDDYDKRTGTVPCL